MAKKSRKHINLPPLLAPTTASTIAANATAKAAAWKAASKPDVSHLPLLDVTTLPSTVLMQTLGKALTMKRDHGSATEAEFVGWLVNRLPVTMIDAIGNVHVDLRRDAVQHRTMFTAHTDTVHHGGGVNAVRVDGNLWRADGAPLGADDGAGVAILCHMIERGVPGYYIFFRGEERGGIGSSWLAQEMPELLTEFTRAVAFDRADQADVITYQSGGRCCSDAFAEALSDALNQQGLLYMPCDGGVYTDTAEFVDTIPECTNLSVGYKHQHGDREYQDVAFLQQLAAAAVAIDWDALPVRRDPRAREVARGYYGHGRGAAPLYDSGYTRWADDAVMDAYPPAMATMSASNDDTDWPALDDAEQALLLALDDAWDGNTRELEKLLCAYLIPDEPDTARTYLRMSRLSPSDIDAAQDALYDGWAADTVLADLVESCQVP